MQRFYLVGEDAASALDVDISTAKDVETLKTLVAGQFAIVEPSGVLTYIFLTEAVADPQKALRSRPLPRSRQLMISARRLTL